MIRFFLYKRLFHLTTLLVIGGLGFSLLGFFLQVTSSTQLISIAHMKDFYFIIFFQRHQNYQQANRDSFEIFFFESDMISKYYFLIACIKVIIIDILVKSRTYVYNEITFKIEIRIFQLIINCNKFLCIPKMAILLCIG